MKTKKFEKKLVLNKSTISDLSPKEIGAVYGGASGQWCTQTSPSCCSILTQCQSDCAHCD
jgi:hypothetical protein